MPSSNGSPDAPVDAAALYSEELSNGSPTSPRDHLHALWRGKWFILSLVVILGGAAYFYYQNQPRLYQASTALLLNEPERSSSMTEFLPKQALMRSPNRISREIYFLRNSEVFAQKVARELLTRKDSLSPPSETTLLWQEGEGTRSVGFLASGLSKAVSVQQDVEELPALRISVTSSDPEEAALVANTYADMYQTHLRRSSNAEMRATRNLLEEQKRTMHAQLRALEDSVAERVRSSRQRGLLSSEESGPGAANQLAGKIAELRHQKEKVKLDLTLEQALLDSAKARLRRIRPNLADRAASTTSTRLRKTQEEITALKSEIELIRARNEPSPRLKARLSDKKARLDTLQQRANQLAAEYVDQSLSTDAIRPLGGESGGGLGSVVDLRRQITERRLSVTRLSTKLEALNERIEKHRAALRESPDGTLARLRRRKATTQELFVSLSEKLQQTQISTEASSQQSEVLRPAAPPAAPIAPNIWNKVVLACLLGGVGGGGLTLLYNQFDDIIETPDDLSTSSEELFGTIPEWSADPAPEFDESDAPWPGIAAPFSPAAESYRQLATNIRLGLPHAVSIIVVTSPGAQEGKTTTSSNLAVALTEVGKDVLMIDADLQGPTLHRLFGADRAPGLTDRLSDESDAVQLLSSPEVQSSGGNGSSVESFVPEVDTSLEQQKGQLGLLAAGRSIPQPSLLLQQRHLQPLLERVEASWDVVLIDTPPALFYDDAFRLASLSDLTLLLAAAQQTRQRAVQDVHTRLGDLCSHPIAEVLNCASASAPASYSYNYTSSYYPSQKAERSPTERFKETVSRGVRRVMKG
ncbi:MAG: hypothetical protein BRD55_07420 [Bacteroidetes bacterium SW_9_63_38]|nr:MAG: hypothetical protein BRD55_07420 [Bacteroidetes bacterium SW_9_63_38]